MNKVLNLQEAKTLAENYLSVKRDMDSEELETVFGIGNIKTCTLCLKASAGDCEGCIYPEVGGKRCWDQKTYKAIRPKTLRESFTFAHQHRLIPKKTIHARGKFIKKLVAKYEKCIPETKS